MSSQHCPAFTGASAQQGGDADEANKAFGSKKSDSAGINRTRLGIQPAFPPVFLRCALWSCSFPDILPVAYFCFLAWLPCLSLCLNAHPCTVFANASSPAPDLVTPAVANIQFGQLILPAPRELTTGEMTGGINKFSDSHPLPQHLFSHTGDGKNEEVAQSCLSAGPLHLQSHCCWRRGDGSIRTWFFHGILCTRVSLWA